MRLEIRDYIGPARWRWVLTEADGTFIKDYEVHLDETAWQFEAFRDMDHYLRWHVPLDRCGIDDKTIAAEVGVWITAQVLGPIAMELVKQGQQRHVTVAVVAHSDAIDLLLRPLHLARIEGKPLVAQNVTLVMQLHEPGKDDPR